MNLPELKNLQETCLIKNETGELFLSLYNDTLTPEGLEKGINKIKASFPTLPLNFYGILMDRIKSNQYTDNQLMDSVNHVIENCVYPTPTIANFLGYENKKRLYTYNQVLTFIHENRGTISDTFDNLKIEGQTFWTLKI